MIPASLRLPPGRRVCACGRVCERGGACPGGVRGGRVRELLHVGVLGVAKCKHV